MSTASPSTTSPRSGLIGPMVLMSAMVLTVCAVEAGVRVWLADAAPAATSTAATSFINLDRDPASLGRETATSPLVLVIGNSHTYTLPSTVPGRPMRAEQGGILPDELSRQFLSEGRSPRVALLAYPNFVPLEMLLRYAQLDEHDYRPRVVVLGLTLRNWVRGVQVREQVRACLREPKCVERLGAILQNAAPADRDALQPLIDAELEHARQAAERDRLKSHADRWDESLFAAARSHSALMYDADEARRRLYRSLYGRFQAVWEQRQTEFTFAPIEADMEINFHAIHVLLDWFRRREATVVVYLAPERSDLSPMLDPKFTDATVPELVRELTARGVTVVDARRVVPADYWGYDMDLPDRSHFTEEGHRRLAAFLLEQAPPLQTIRREKQAD